MANNPIQILYSGVTTNTPTLGLGATESNIALNGVDGQLFWFDGTTTQSFDLMNGAGIGAVIEDLTPQLGGDLDVTGQSLITLANADIVLAPNGTGGIDVSTSKIVNLVDPTADQDAATKKYTDDSVAAALVSAMNYAGTADASAVDEDAATGTSTHNNGDLYRVTTSGAVAFGFQLDVGDFVIFNGTTWDRIDAVDPTVSGTASRVAVTGNSSTGFVVDIDAAYVGQGSITTVGTIASGTWEGGVIGQAFGGTGADLSGLAANALVRNNAGGTAFEAAVVDTDYLNPASLLGGQTF